MVFKLDVFDNRRWKAFDFVASELGTDLGSHTNTPEDDLNAS